MMKFTGAIGTLLSAVVAVPAVALGQHGADEALGSLEDALRRTVDTIEVLSGIRDTAQAGVPATAALVMSVTEAPVAEERERDEKLQLLRTQVSLLQQELDVVEARIFDHQSEPPAVDITPAAPLPQPADGFTQGLDPSAISALRDMTRPKPLEVTSTNQDPAIEHEGYSADALLQAQACHRGRQYTRGLTLLETDNSPAGLYWRARCLEGLERLDEAAALYERVAALEDGGSYVERAQTNLEFVVWKSKFVGELPTREKSTSDE